MANLIINLTQHLATQEQKESGVIDLPERYRNELVQLLTFDELPTCKQIERRASQIYDIVIDFCKDEQSPIKNEVEKLIEDKDDEYGYIIDEKEFREFELCFMIGGAPFLMSALERELSYIGKPLYAFSRREVVEQKQEDGSVKKVSVFKHLGFVGGC